MRSLYSTSRYIVAFIVLQYGFAKLTGAQFTVLESELDKPMREVSGFWLTWYYFSYSPIYGNFVGVLQIVMGILLFFRKATLIASCVLLAVMSNIVLIDIFYAIDFFALLEALIVSSLLVFIMWQHRTELIHLFWTQQNTVLTKPLSKKGGLARVALASSIVIYTSVGAYFAANFNNRSPTELDGNWRVEEVSGSSAEQIPDTIYFERNRAHMVVFRFSDTFETHHFELNPAGGELVIWEEWLSKGNLIFEGQYSLQGDRLFLTGELEGKEVELRLEKPR